MHQPRWDDPSFKAGTMVRGALWLLQVVGVGNTFTKGQVREAFPNVSQADRRIRDLRDYNWVVYSSSEDASLLAEDQRFVKPGIDVWDAKARREASSKRAIPSKTRHAILSRDDFMCTLCGIAGGEPYPDDPVITAVLAVSRRLAIDSSGHELEELVTECKRCRSGRDEAPVDVRSALTAATSLNPGDQRRLLRWMNRGRRGSTDLDRAWAAYRRVPPAQRPDFVDMIETKTGINLDLGTRRSQSNSKNFRS